MILFLGISIPPPPSMMSFPPPRLTASTTLTASTNFRHQMRPRAPIHFSGRVLGKPSDTLIIRKIPREHNTITKLSSHFERFGTIVNLNVSVNTVLIIPMSILSLLSTYCM